VTSTERVALVGWGAIGRHVAATLAQAAPTVGIVAVAVANPDIDRPDLPARALLISDATELASTRPTVVVEAGGRDSVAQWGFAAFDAGADFIVSSVSAFADPELLTSMKAAAVAAGRQLHIQPGALGGVDALSAARHMGVDRVEHRMVKPPQAWTNTPAEDLCDLAALTEATTFYTGTATETALAFPKNANVAMTTALAGVGPEATTITLIADPAATKNRHEISASGQFGTLEIAIANNPLPSNPKSSAMAALNLVRTIQSRTATFVI
jgi:aspartate dehydrogenase